MAVSGYLLAFFVMVALPCSSLKSNQITCHVLNGITAMTIELKEQRMDGYGARKEKIIDEIYKRFRFVLLGSICSHLSLCFSFYWDIISVLVLHEQFPF